MSIDLTDTTPSRIFWDGGRAAPPGWLPAGPAAPLALVSEGLPLPSGTASGGYVGPALSGVPQWQVVGVLEEFRRVLVPGGVLRVATFDLDAAVRAYQAGDRDFFWYDDWDDPSGAFAEHVLEAGAARSLFAAPLLVELLRRAGFEAVAVRTFGCTGGDPELAAPDRFGDHCCFAEGLAPPGRPHVTIHPAPAQVHLSWSDRRCRRVAVTWCGPASAHVSARLRVSGDRDWLPLVATAAPTIDGVRAPYVFRAVSPELPGGQRYEYEIVHEVGGRATPPFQGSFDTLSEHGGAGVAFAFMADTGLVGRPDGLCDGAARVVEEVTRTDAAFVLAGGDFAYRSGDPRLGSAGDGVRAWLDQMAPLATRRPLLVQYGNHEVELGERHRDWAPHFPPPGGTSDHRCYSIDAGPCHVTAFYAPTSAVAPEAVAWLEADLAAARAGGARWVVVFQHQPLFAHGSSHPAEGPVRAALAPTLERHRVDLHLSAHDQSFERTYPIIDADTAPRVVSTSPSRYNQGDGVVYAKVSPAGKRSDRGRDFSRLPSSLPPYIAVAHDDGHHFSYISATPQQLLVRTYGLASGTAPLQIIDEFIIASAAADLRRPTAVRRPPPSRRPPPTRPPLPTPGPDRPAR